MNKKVIERILKNLLENETYTLDKEEIRILLNYIAYLQRKEYNNSKAVEYTKTLYSLGIANERCNFYNHSKNKEQLEDWEEIFDVLVSEQKDLLNILEDNNE